MSRAQQILQTVFGYSRFRPPQDRIIDTLVDGQDAIVVMPTGGGKSLCYQIPSLARVGTGVVVSPLIALMQDQVAALTQLGVRAAALHSALEFNQVKSIERALLNGQLDLLYVAPERLVGERMLELLSRSRIALFAIDEAHCVSQWGHDFRPEYMQLAMLADRFPGVPRIALTATADGTTREEIKTRLHLPDAHIFVCGFDRPNIRYRVAQDSGDARTNLLKFLREEHSGDSGIVYCLSRKRVEDTATWMSEQGLIALPYHAGLSPAVRESNQKRFLNEDGVIIVATIAFGMGIDKPNVRFVAHLNLPKSIEAYYQETGRAGRDNLPANAWLSYGLSDVITLRQWVEASEADDKQKQVERHKLEAMLGFCEMTTCRRQALLTYFGDTLETPCGNCDNCLTPAVTWDATTPARQALSCILRTGQRFGATHIVDVLRGAANERIKRHSHQRLSTYGIGKDLTADAWRALLRQLIVRGFVAVDAENFGALYVTRIAVPLLQGQISVPLRRLDANSRKVRGSDRGKFTFKTESQQRLWEKLREKRRALATQAGVPPYVIFHDATLLEIAAKRPNSLADLADIPGMGEHKLARYGKIILDVVRETSDADALALE